MCETLLASRSESRVERAGFWMEGTGTVSNGPSGGQIMLIAIMLALWRMYR